MTGRALIIDHEACWGCLACEVACKQENSVDPGIKLIRVFEEPVRERDGRPSFTFTVNACRHGECEGTPCVSVCPTGAIVRREDGLVIMTAEECIGCEACVGTCPWEAIAVNRHRSVTQKCNLCHHRVDRGLAPACADNVCLARAIHFGDPEEIRPRIEARRRVRERV
jgi:Fe-S-cluster-containing dehydrogenase component